MTLKDASDRNLKDGFYIGPSGQIYYIRVSRDTFSAENSLVGFMQVKDYQKGSRELIKLSDPEEDAKFILSKLKRKN